MSAPTDSTDKCKKYSSNYKWTNETNISYVIPKEQDIHTKDILPSTRHVDIPGKIVKIAYPPATKPKPQQKAPVSTTDKQSMAYVIVKNIESETSYLQSNWTTFVLKELEDNAYDWLNDYYPAKSPKDKEIRKIAVRIWITTDKVIDDKFVHIAVRNSNVDNISVFPDLNKTFDFDNWHSTKRNQHRMTCGSLGDALKRCLGMGYASWIDKNRPDETFEDMQWNEPIIVRCNGCEYKAFIKIDSSKQKIWTEIQQENKPTRNIGNDTEIEVTLPVVQEQSYSGEEGNWLARLKRYYQIYKIGKSRTDFNLDLDCGPFKEGQCQGQEHEREGEET
jgi:hypothetical protein